MARLLDELRVYLEAAVPGPTYNAMEFLASSPDRAVAIRPAPGMGPDLDAPTTHVTVQLLVRGPSSPFYQSYDDAWALYRAFNSADGTGGRSDFRLATLRVLWAIPRHPIWVGRDSNGRPMYSVNVNLKVQVPS